MAVDDSATITNNLTALIDVLLNDTDGDEDTLSITEFTQGVNGTVTQEGDSLRYTPNAGFIGVDDSDNPVIAYYQHDIWRWSNGTDNSYYLQLINPLTGATSTPESVSVSNIEVSGGSNITLEYDIGTTHYLRYFDGTTLAEIICLFF